jgi:hypothetical protein
MSTRGAYGFRIDGRDKVTYNHRDSYPSELGVGVLAFIKRNTIEHLRLIALGLRMVDSDDRPTPADVQKYSSLLNAHVGIQDGSPDWYSLIREAQGNFEALENGLDVMIDNQNFLEDSLFCKWAYIINLDTLTLEVYEGSNYDQFAPGRYSDFSNTTNPDYFGVALVKEIALSRIQHGHLDILTTKLVQELESEQV